jgi:DivIVA domain-containing protein
MIDLTPLEVRQKKGDFRRSVRGYDAELVNDFLDLVADRMEELVKENMGLRDSVESLKGELEQYRQKQRALSDALMTAQKLREDARSHAEKESELLVREARAEAELARQDAARALLREEDALRQVRARRAQLVQSFRRLLERELTELEVVEETLELEGTHLSRRVQVSKPAPKPQPKPDSKPAPEIVAEERPEPETAVEERPEPEERLEEENEDQDADWLKSLVEE